ncbi:PLP-dependent aminotransferase family protein [Brevibacillus sp. SYSU BS000544]|uniref:MocR-like pyridoxine biosynthesis transcription factor PdxR n=1 Tax=Brevibacillus sp. SYSU BS000544 TaxID=3416443 RepID=UPI003CE58A98
MEWKPDKESSIPLYQQIADYIQKRIAYGEYLPGSFLPSERALAKQLGVNRGTVVSSYDVLFSCGIVEREKGSGTKVGKNVCGLSSRQFPNWDLYVERGSYSPNLPLHRRIHEEVHQENLINFACCELADDLTPYDIVQKILTTHHFQQPLRYEHPQGNLELRRSLATHLKTFKNIDCTSQSILITSGVKQAIHIIIQCLLQPGDAVAIEDPSYANSIPIFRSAHLKTYRLPVGKNGIDPEEIRYLYRKHKIKMVFLNPLFQNPTGSILSLEKRKRVLEITQELGIPVVEDDPYSLLSLTKHTDTSTLKSLDTGGTVLYVSSLSKILSSGLRIGWIIGPDPVIQRLADVKQQIDYGHSVIPQWIAAEFLTAESFEPHLQQVKAKLLEKRDTLVSALQEHLSEHVTFEVPKGGIHLWCKLLTKVNEFQLMEEALHEGVLFVPGSLLSLQSGFIRLTYGRTETHQIQEGIIKLKKALLRVSEGVPK